MRIFLLIVIFLGCQAVVAAENAGKTVMALGSVKAKDPDSERSLRRRAPIFDVDTVFTGEASRSQLRMKDGALLSLQENSELVIEAYQYDEASNDGQVSLNLLKGGLRTVTGALQTSGGNYKLNTPVASMGVRGTHYEVEIDDSNLYLVVWDGVVDVEVFSGSGGFSLGPELDYKFAIVKSDGSVEFLLESPSLFGSGHSNSPEDDQDSQEEESQDSPLVETELESESDVELASGTDITGQNEQEASPAELIGAEIVESEPISDDFPDSPSEPTTPTTPEPTTPLEGTMVFDQVQGFAITSSVGDVSNVAGQMTLDFTSGRVSDGQLSFDDPQGEWLALFDGIVLDEQLDLSVNFASHGDNLADGEISGSVDDVGPLVLGELNLFEIDDPDISVSGTFELGRGN